MNAKQFSWGFMYPGLDNRFEKKDDVKIDNELHVPVDKLMEVTIGSEDVIHSFLIPTFRLKQDDAEYDQGGTGTARGRAPLSIRTPRPWSRMPGGFSGPLPRRPPGSACRRQDQAVGDRRQKPQNDQTDCLWPRHISRMGFVLFINARDVENTAVMKKTRYI